MKKLKIILAFVLLSVTSLVITGAVLTYLGIEHGSLVLKVGFSFAIANLVLYLLLLIYFVAKNLHSIFSEKKRKAVGSKFRTKLVVSFLALVLIPSSVLFFLSYQLINSSIDTWFSLEVQEPVFESMVIATKIHARERAHAGSYARLLSSRKDILQRTSDLIKDDSGTLRGYVLRRPDGTEIVRQGFNGVESTDTASTDRGDIIRAVSPIREGGRIAGVVVVESIIPREEISRMESIQKAFSEYIQVGTRQEPIRLLYFLFLTLATLLIIFLTIWVSLRIAKSITVPIQSLAEATKTVGHGDLDYRINLRRDDEIGLLIDSFNGMLDDLQEGKQSVETAYREADRRRLSMEIILESINSGVIFFDRSSRVTTLNNAACAMLNVDKKDVEGKSYRELLGKLKSEEVTSMVKHLIDKGYGSVEKEVHLYMNDRPVDMRVYMTTIEDSANDFIGTLVVFDNLTEIVMAQRALAWQEVAKRIAHEIKNPLTPIRLSAERILKKWNDRSEDFSDVLERSTKTIVQEVNSLRSLVDEFSRFGKMPKITLEPTSISSLVAEVVNLYSNHKEIDIVTSFNADVPEIEIDRKQLKMALINLIDNAIQANSQKIWLNAIYNAALDFIRIEVIDEGVGIKAEDKDKLFFPYFSTKKEGTGLGLAIVNSIISKHRGYIRVQDNKPRGTQFIIELPVAHK